MLTRHASERARLPRAFDDGLFQEVAITPAVAQTGGAIEIRSVLRSRAVSAFQLTSRICGLTYGDRTVVDEPPGLSRCAGYAMTRALAPGDSIVVPHRMQVVAGPGAHTLRVQHALSPDHWVEVLLAVQQP